VAAGRPEPRRAAGTPVPRGPNPRKTEPLVAADIAVEHLADMEAEIDLRGGQSLAGAMLVEPREPVLQRSLRRDRRAAGLRGGIGGGKRPKATPQPPPHRPPHFLEAPRHPPPATALER